jgi:DHA1 family bicyclomycin/chloramphenicol resistance-like MFS transporter
MGAVMMALAFVSGTIVGVTHNGTLYPLAIISAVLGTLNFLSVRLIGKRTVVA